MKHKGKGTAPIRPIPERVTFRIMDAALLRQPLVSFSWQRELPHAPIGATRTLREFTVCGREFTITTVPVIVTVDGEDGRERYDGLRFTAAHKNGASRRWNVSEDAIETTVNAAFDFLAGIRPENEEPVNAPPKLG
ncbi:hypothetical protein BISA_2338 [Bifidobacterium saguini DSM 23967]|uniref:Uncharacterized protein n=2 Tax=Bifidobacterium saguini TaxID=762210 RepID=A0A087D246_9BIFI|nr:hypothetical protein [Bifidobacterium saguini]KFI89596.1 hypothetical protein BISA_2338 [Bifidobacterium saguini DSM 23967]QTB90699.1 hypothetical protein BSD967_10455 [Bifidobacterium saguini]